MTEIYPEDSEQIKEVKRLFNAVDTDGFRRYFKENNLSPNIVDSHGRGVFHWWARADLKAAGIFNPTLVVPILLVLGNDTVSRRFSIKYWLITSLKTFFDRGVTTGSKMKTETCRLTTLLWWIRIFL